MKKDIRKLGGKTLLSHVPLPQLLSLAYPDVNFDYFKLKTAAYKKSQHVLKTMLKTLFPQEGYFFLFVCLKNRNARRV